MWISCVFFFLQPQIITAPQCVLFFFSSPKSSSPRPAPPLYSHGPTLTLSLSRCLNFVASAGSLFGRTSFSPMKLSFRVWLLLVLTDKPKLCWFYWFNASSSFIVRPDLSLTDKLVSICFCLFDLVTLLSICFCLFDLFDLLLLLLVQFGSVPLLFASFSVWFAFGGSNWCLSLINCWDSRLWLTIRKIVAIKYITVLKQNFHV